MLLVLASASPARRRALQRAGIDPVVLVSGVDESQLSASSPRELVAALARAKADQVLGEHTPGSGAAAIDTPAVLVACDTIVEFEGRVCGKPGSPERVVEQWQQVRGREAQVHTGHEVILLDGDQARRASRVVTTTVRFADLSDEEIEAYSRTAEPVGAAGGFSIDGLAGPFVTSIDGDPHNVVGISLPALRQLLLDLGVAWHELWSNHN